VVSVGGGTRSATRFADNRITQNVQGQSVSVSVECAFGQSHGSASTNDLSDESLKGVVERAQASARVSPPDPEYMLPVDAAEADQYPQADCYAPATAEHDPMAKAECIAAMAERTAARDLRLSGIYTTASGFSALANSAGLRAYHRSTKAEVRASVLGANSSGWAQQQANDVTELDPADVAERALAIAVKGRNPADSEAGKYTVVLHPEGVSEMLLMMMTGFDAKGTDEGRTFMREKLGTKICGDAITIRSDPTDPRCPVGPFQGGGLAARKLTWVDRGVAKNLFYSRYWAKKKNVEPTGRPCNILMDGGDSSIQEMVASTERGLLITRFWYIRFIDPMVPSLTGMTRDGVFRIEDGEVVGPMKNMRFNENVPDVLSRVEALGTPQRVGFYAPMLLPPIKVRDFNFGSTTKF